MTTSKGIPEAFGRYRIIKELGTGGMGSVYLAEDTKLSRRVALKVPHFSPNHGQEVLERFYREARALAAFQHPNICTVYDVDQIDDTHYLTMPHIEGRPLSDLAQKRLTPRQVALLVRKLAIAMEEAHRRGIIHRDLKPSNILLNKQAEPIIMDFGLARSLVTTEERLTATGEVLGTPAYMAPEQAAGRTREIGPSCDIYSLGVMMYELLTGQLPFHGSLGEVLVLILTENPKSPCSLRPDLDPKLDAICCKAMAKKIPERYSSMAELAATLTDFLRERELPARPEAPSTRFKPQELAAVKDRTPVAPEIHAVVSDSKWALETSAATAEQVQPGLTAESGSGAQQSTARLLEKLRMTLEDDAHQAPEKKHSQVEALFNELQSRGEVKLLDAYETACNTLKNSPNDPAAGAIKQLLVTQARLRLRSNLGDVIGTGLFFAILGTGLGGVLFWVIGLVHGISTSGALVLATGLGGLFALFACVMVYSVIRVLAGWTLNLVALVGLSGCLAGAAVGRAIAVHELWWPGGLILGGVTGLAMGSSTVMHSNKVQK